jgi:hypothetical protein
MPEEVDLEIEQTHSANNATAFRANTLLIERFRKSYPALRSNLASGATNPTGCSQVGETTA